MRRAWLVVLLTACGPVISEPDAEVDSGASDSGTLDAGTPDAGTDDGVVDAGVVDAGVVDAGVPDAGTPDAGTPDAGPVDSGAEIISPRDAGPVILDSGLPWSWLVVSAVLAMPPSDAGLRARWVEVSPPAVDRAWAGGVLLFDGGVVAIPFNESSVLLIHPADDTSERWPVAGGAVGEGWQGGVLLPDGVVIGIPHNATRFLRIDPALGTATPFGDDVSDAGATTGSNRFNGGVLGLNGLVYAAPATANFIARLDPATGAVTRLPLPAPMVRGSTRGAVLFPTGDIVMFPGADTPGVLVVPSRDGGQDEVWLLPRPSAPGAPAFTGGGTLTGVDTAFAPPEQNALPLLYRAGLLSWAPAVPGLGVPMANAYLYAAWSTDGHLYSPPYGADSALRSGELAELLPLDAGPSWFRGLLGAVGLPDGRIIAIPHSRSAWLELAPTGRVTVPMEAMTSPFLNKL